MRSEAALADRRAEVRSAARGWRRAGAIDDATLASIEATYPDDRARLGPVFRTVAFVFACFAIMSLFGVAGLCAGEDRFGGLSLVFAAGLVVATEILVGPLRRADSGVEAATALMAVVFGTVGIVWLLWEVRGHSYSLAFVLSAVLFAATILAALASLRWGSFVLAAAASVCFFLLLGRFPLGRVLWIVAALALLPPLLVGSESPRLPPTHRRSCMAGLAVAFLALYASVHLGSWDSQLIESLRDSASGAPPGGVILRRLMIAGTALVPIAVVAFAVLTRRTFLLGVGIGLGVASLVTLRYYVHVAPAWVVLVVSGAVALLIVLAVRRFLSTGPGGERGGFTAEPLFEDVRRRQGAEMLATVAALSPGAQPAAAEGGLKGGGGSYGGGGATDSF